MGYKVIGVCSPHSFDLVKSYGADEVISYRDGVKAGEEIKRISGGGITLAIDTISEGESYKIALSSFKEGVEGQLNMILFPPEEAHKLRPDVKLIVTIMYTLFGHVRAIQLHPDH
jgi:NADPH:quinone reductase-like Zn-dependent oxidoreductase